MWWLRFATTREGVTHTAARVRGRRGRGGWGVSRADALSHLHILSEDDALKLGGRFGSFRHGRAVVVRVACVYTLGLKYRFRVADEARGFAGAQRTTRCTGCCEGLMTRTQT